MNRMRNRGVTSRRAAAYIAQRCGVAYRKLHAQPRLSVASCSSSAACISSSRRFQFYARCPTSCSDSSASTAARCEKLVVPLLARIVTGMRVVPVAITYTEPYALVRSYRLLIRAYDEIGMPPWLL